SPRPPSGPGRRRPRRPGRRRGFGCGYDSRFNFPPCHERTGPSRCDRTDGRRGGNPMAGAWQRVRRAAAATARATAAACRGTYRAGRTTVQATRRAARGAGRAARRLTHAQGAGRSGLGRLIELTAAHSAGDALVTVALAGTLFFGLPVNQARGQVA